MLSPFHLVGRNFFKKYSFPAVKISWRVNEYNHFGRQNGSKKEHKKCCLILMKSSEMFTKIRNTCTMWSYL